MQYRSFWPIKGKTFLISKTSLWVLHLLSSQEGLSLLDLVTIFSVGWDSVVGVAAHYRLDSLGIESQ